MNKDNRHYSVPELDIYRYRFEFSYSQPCRLPHYPGSAWRGAFGHALKRTVCVVRNTPCAACMLQSNCAYAYIFETPPPVNAGKMRKYNASPHPFAFQFIHRSLPEPEYYRFDLMLFGYGQRYLPYIIHALQRAGREGIGGGRQVFELAQVSLIDHNQQNHSIFTGDTLSAVTGHSLPSLPPVPNKLRLNFVSPLRIKQQGKNMTANTLSFAALFGNLLRRISMLTFFHSDTPLETDFQGLTQQARELEFNHKNVHWYDWTRYSNRQQTEMKMGGLLGSVELDLSAHPQFWPYLWLGQWTNAGKATSMGMGQYLLEAASLSAETD